MNNAFKKEKNNSSRMDTREEDRRGKKKEGSRNIISGTLVNDVWTESTDYEYKLDGTMASFSAYSSVGCKSKTKASAQQIMQHAMPKTANRAHSSYTANNVLYVAHTDTPSAALRTIVTRAVAISPPVEANRPTLLRQFTPWSTVTASHHYRPQTR